MSRLQARALHKSYGPTRVLTGVDFDFPAGAYVVLVGPSGCGKSTLLRCIAGLETITSGDLLIGDRRVNDVAPKDRDVAMVFQSYALYPHMTVRENMAFALTIRKEAQSEIDRKVDDAARLLELIPLLDRYPAQLSGGQRQRVAMGRAIVRAPGVFLFDEPLSNLDPALRAHMRVELKRLHKKLGATIVHVTHDQIEALTLADRIVVLHQGVVQQIGAPRELYERPANTFVARFIGAPPMNLLPVSRTGEAWRLGASGPPLPVRGPDAFQLGVRPVDVHLGEGALQGTVDVIESLGHEAVVHVDLAGHEVLALVPEPCAWRSGDRVSLTLGTVHGFHPETGQRVEVTPA
jgi:multiple sugar transport system ATP-binding protein